MILTLAFCARDKALAVRLAEWIADLGGTSRHDCLLGYAADTSVQDIADILKPCFRNLGGFKIDNDATAYPLVANESWKAMAYKIADEFKEPWLWMEPDGVPLVPEWMDKIEDEYKKAGKPFMLDRVVTPTRSHNSGTGVYPGLVRDYTQKLWALDNIPWDVFFAEDFTPFTHHTNLIHDKFLEVWEDQSSGPPLFPTVESLALIEPEAVVFHRNKNGNLIKWLRQTRGSVRPTRPAVIAGETAGSSPALATPPDANIIARLERIEKHLGFDLALEMMETGTAREESVVKEPKKRGVKMKEKPSRTPEQIQAAKDRMAKARAARKPVLA